MDFLFFLRKDRDESQTSNTLFEIILFRETIWLNFIHPKHHKQVLFPTNGNSFEQKLYE